MGQLEDPYNLVRFEEAQSQSLSLAKMELFKGRKTSHWMWYIFPQLSHLGYSDTAKYYGIKNLEEAKAYFAHPVLGKNLLDCCNILLQHNEKSALAILGSPDNLKLKSCATLFLETSHEPVFKKILDEFFEGKSDQKTLQFLK
ncbi:DUF1810 domain-containing protein [Litoribacter populi]|uniref:DUF1810 domain-containing protein n=1 Tax=Litoribacter populi TaxID=2598460 RepID=UPI001180F4ED|nr:DUF1810 domain-containing protein [Litoribacter populi]